MNSLLLKTYDDKSELLKVDSSKKVGTIDLKSIPFIAGFCNNCLLQILNAQPAASNKVACIDTATICQRWCFDAGKIELPEEVFTGDAVRDSKIKSYYSQQNGVWLNHFLTTINNIGSVEILEDYKNLFISIMGCTCGRPEDKFKLCSGKDIFLYAPVISRASFGDLPPVLGPFKGLKKIEKKIIPSLSEISSYFSSLKFQDEGNFEEFEKKMKEVSNDTLKFFDEKLDWYDYIPADTKIYLNKMVGKNVLSQEIPSFLIKSIKQGRDVMDKVIDERFTQHYPIQGEMKKKILQRFGTTEIPKWVIDVLKKSKDPYTFLTDVQKGIAKENFRQKYLLSLEDCYKRIFKNYLLINKDSSTKLWIKMGGLGKTPFEVNGLFNSNQDLFQSLVDRGFLTKNNYKLYGKRLPPNINDLIMKINKIPFSSEKLDDSRFLKKGSLVLKGWVRSFLTIKGEKTLTNKQRISKLLSGSVNEHNFQKEVRFSPSGSSKGAVQGPAPKKRIQGKVQKSNAQPKPGPVTYASITKGNKGPSGWKEAFGLLSQSVANIQQMLAPGRMYQGPMGYLNTY